jgi:hypothetical protein
MEKARAGCPHTSSKLFLPVAQVVSNLKTLGEK